VRRQSVLKRTHHRHIPARLTAVTAVREGGRAMPDPVNVEAGGAAPAIWRVLLLNDDHTPMEFVVHVLQELFDMDHDLAVQLMLHVHNAGMGECGVYTETMAKAKVEAVAAMARQHQHPLQCVMERQQSA